MRPQKTRHVLVRSYFARLIAVVCASITLVGIGLLVALIVAAEWHVRDRVLPPGVTATAAVVLQGNGDEILRLTTAKNLLATRKIELIVCVGGARPEWNLYRSHEAGAWLINQGVPPAQIHCDDRTSRDTVTNLDEAVRVLGRDGWHHSVLVSDALHLLRADTLASVAPYGRPLALAASDYRSVLFALWRAVHELAAWPVDFFPTRIRSMIVDWTRR